MLIYHPLRWREIHDPVDLDFLYEEDSLLKKDLAEAGVSAEELKRIRVDHDGFNSVIEGFEECGSNIFHLQPALVEMFRNSSVDEVSMDSLKTPFETIYVYFGEASKIKVAGGTIPVDGAYISNYSYEGEVCFCISLTQPMDMAALPKLTWLERLAKDTYFEFIISAAEGKGVTIREAFDDHFVNTYERIGRENWASLSEIFREGKTYEEAVANWKPDEKYRDPAIRPALNLIFNAVCYLAYEKREVVERYPTFAPERLVKQAVSGGTYKERNRGRSKLESNGFRQVYFCGDSIERRVAQSHREVGGSVSPHWRRGHWRHQAHGVGMSLRKLMWIEPLIVKEGTGETAGHIYIPKVPK